MKLEELINIKLSRRNLLKGAALFTAASIIPYKAFGGQKDLAQNIIGADTKVILSSTSQLNFSPIPPSDADAFVLPEEFNYTIIRKWGDMINDSEEYGINNDFVAYLPIDALQNGQNSEDGLLVVNHEFPSPLFCGGYTDEDLAKGVIKTQSQIDAERKSVGMSVFRVKKINGRWEFLKDSGYNRRIDANTPVQLNGKASGSKELDGITIAKGTLANCSGGVTPWNTVLSGEENFQDYPMKEVYRWTDQGEIFDVKQYGWVVEIDPFDKSSIPKKRTSLGRFRHENVCIVLSGDGRAVAYMGDDKINECVYKFISKNKFDPDDRNANMDILDEGDLYVADFENNVWQLIDFNQRAELKENFKSQADVLINCSTAAKFVGGTECNRPEDIEFNPVDKSLYVSFTNNSTKGDYFGNIINIVENANDSGSLQFKWDVFVAGGEQSGLTCPDNITIDKSGNLWVLTDVGAGSLNKGVQAPFKNNSLFMIPTIGENKGKVFRFAAGPVDCELCGGNFTPDGSTMFLSVQHPGENSPSLDKLTSHWPDGGNDIPRSAVIAITGFNKA